MNMPDDSFSWVGAEQSAALLKQIENDTHEAQVLRSMLGNIKHVLMGSGIYSEAEIDDAVMGRVPEEQVTSKYRSALAVIRLMNNMAKNCHTKPITSAVSQKNYMQIFCSMILKISPELFPLDFRNKIWLEKQTAALAASCKWENSPVLGVKFIMAHDIDINQFAPTIRMAYCILVWASIIENHPGAFVGMDWSNTFNYIINGQNNIESAKNSIDTNVRCRHAQIVNYVPAYYSYIQTHEAQLLASQINLISGNSHVINEEKTAAAECSSMSDGTPQQKLLNILKSGPLKAKAIGEALGMKPAVLKNELLAVAIKEGLVEQTEESPNSPKQAYRLTEKGKGVCSSGA